MLISFMLIFICSSDKLHFWAIFEFLGVKDEMKKNEMILFIIQEEMKKTDFSKTANTFTPSEDLKETQFFTSFVILKQPS